VELADAFNRLRHTTFRISDAIVAAAALARDTVRRRT